MEIGQFQIENNDEKIKEIFYKISGEQISDVKQICEQYGEEPGDVRHYDVYVVETDCGNRILKKTGKREVFNYERYLAGHAFAVPEFLGKFDAGEEQWILLSDIAGSDVRDMTDEIARKAADSLVEIQNAYWNHPDEERFFIYKERIEKRFRFIKDVPVVGEAYRIFLNRQISCPRTLSNGDVLQFNAVDHAGKVVIIDWGFGGIMPYSLDIARFIAHGTTDRATFPFYMNEAHKKIFVNRIYEKMQQKPEYETYLFDIRLAVLNEYVEFVEADEDDSGWYASHADRLAREILNL